MNSFDIAMAALFLVSGISGFATGLIRSVASLLAWLIATGVAVWATPLVLPYVVPYLPMTPLRDIAVFLLTLVVLAVVLGILVQMLLTAMFGPRVSFGDRVAGLALGFVRALLVAVLLVLMFERLMPADRQPAFLQGSRARPVLSMLAAHGLRSLPPQVQYSVERLRSAITQQR